MKNLKIMPFNGHKNAIELTDIELEVTVENSVAHMYELQDSTLKLSASLITSEPVHKEDICKKSVEGILAATREMIAARDNLWDVCIELLRRNDLQRWGIDGTGRKLEVLTCNNISFANHVCYHMDSHFEHGIGNPETNEKLRREAERLMDMEHESLRRLMTTWPFRNEEKIAQSRRYFESGNEGNDVSDILKGLPS